MVLALPAQRYCQKNLKKYNQALMKKRDERVDFTSEVLQGIKAPSALLSLIIGFLVCT